MKSNLVMDFSVDRENSKINVKREFAAPLARVWAAWTQPELLDQWWAPKPWKARTKSMDFTEGGRWLYAMVGPEGEEHWSFAEYKKIIPQKSFTGLDGFSDSEGNINTDLPSAEWQTNFSASEDHTMVDISITYENLADLEQFLQMGFKEGFTMGLENLDELLEK